jgi:hypothetical protein
VMMLYGDVLLPMFFSKGGQWATFHIAFFFLAVLGFELRVHVYKQGRFSII